MIPHIQGLHHVTAFAGPAPVNNRFFTETLGLRRVKVTVNFDNPEVYHLYYGDEAGTPGTVMTHFPFPMANRGKRGTGEVGITAFAIPPGSIKDWIGRLEGGEEVERFGERRLHFPGPDGETLALIETEDPRTPWSALPDHMAIRGFHSVDLTLADPTATIELLTDMGYENKGSEGNVTRLTMDAPVGVIDITHAPDMPGSDEAAGSVHHIAFATPNDDTQAEIRKAVLDRGFKVTPVKDRDYFHSIYFREPGGVLFEVATCDIGFDADESLESLGERLCLPDQHAHLRDQLKDSLEPLPNLRMDSAP